jgi:hypothetical protein
MLAFAVSSALAACDSCDREGCDALGDSVRQRGTGANLAGVAASRSDVVANGCQECTFAEVTVQFWSIPDVVESQAMLDELAPSIGEPLQTLSVDKNYELNLADGAYLACVGSSPASCASFSLGAQQQATLNIRVGNEPGTFFYSDSLENVPKVTAPLVLRSPGL